MNREGGHSRIPALVAAVAVVAGLGLTLYSVKRTQDLLSHVRSKHARLEELAGLRVRHGQVREQVQAFADSGTTAPAALKAVLGNVLPDARADIVELDPQSIGSDVVVRRADMKLDAIQLDQLGALLHRMESYNPPWKIQACRITALPGSRGQGQVNLVVEAFEKE